MTIAPPAHCANNDDEKSHTSRDLITNEMNNERFPFQNGITLARHHKVHGIRPITEPKYENMIDVLPSVDRIFIDNGTASTASAMKSIGFGFQAAYTDDECDGKQLERTSNLELSLWCTAQITFENG